MACVEQSAMETAAMSFKKVMLWLSELSHEWLVGISRVRKHCLSIPSCHWGDAAGGTGTQCTGGLCICASRSLGNFEPFVVFALVFNVQEMNSLYPGLKFSDTV